MVDVDARPISPAMTESHDFSTRPPVGNQLPITSAALGSAGPGGGEQAQVLLGERQRSRSDDCGRVKGVVLGIIATPCATYPTGAALVLTVGLNPSLAGSSPMSVVGLRTRTSSIRARRAMLVSMVSSRTGSVRV